MMRRQSKVKGIYINNVGGSSIFQVGDGKVADPYLRAIAVQKEGPVFFNDPFTFQEFELFYRPFIQFAETLPVNQSHIHKHSTIHVNHVILQTLSGAAIAQVGNLKEIDAKARIKHIRILQEDNHVERNNPERLITIEEDEHKV
jgi:spore germination protein PE